VRRVAAFQEKAFNGLGRPLACGQSRGSGRRDHYALKGKPKIGSGQGQEAESTILIREAAHDDAGIIDPAPFVRHQNQQPVETIPPWRRKPRGDLSTFLAGLE
jgi:hypothetical protein